METEYLERAESSLTLATRLRHFIEADREACDCDDLQAYLAVQMIAIELGTKLLGREVSVHMARQTARYLDMVYRPDSTS